jgi:hypothetical protein
MIHTGYSTLLSHYSHESMNYMINFLEIWYESHVTGGHSGAVLKSLLSETKMEGTKITRMMHNNSKAFLQHRETTNMCLPSVDDTMKY